MKVIPASKNKLITSGNAYRDATCTFEFRLIRRTECDLGFIGVVRFLFAVVRFAFAIDQENSVCYELILSASRIESDRLVMLPAPSVIRRSPSVKCGTTRSVAVSIGPI